VFYAGCECMRNRSWKWPANVSRGMVDCESQLVRPHLPIEHIIPVSPHCSSHAAFCERPCAGLGHSRTGPHHAYSGADMSSDLQLSVSVHATNCLTYSSASDRARSCTTTEPCTSSQPGATRQTLRTPCLSWTPSSKHLQVCMRGRVRMHPRPTGPRSVRRLDDLALLGHVHAVQELADVLVAHVALVLDQRRALGHELDVIAGEN